jgi:hypothetical protein
MSVSVVVRDEATVVASERGWQLSLAALEE